MTSLKKYAEEYRKRTKEYYKRNRNVETDWSKVPVDTLCLVRNNKDEKDDWRYAYFAECECGNVYVWGGGCTSYTADGRKEEFDCVKLAENNK